MSNFTRNFGIVWAYQLQTSLIGIQLAEAKSKIRREFVISVWRIHTVLLTCAHTDGWTYGRSSAHMIIYCWKVDPRRVPWRPPLTWASDGGKRRSLCVVRFHGNIMRCHCEGGPVPQIVIYWLKGCEGVIWSSELAAAATLGVVRCCLCRRRWRLSHTPTDGRRPNNNYAAGAHHAAPGQPSAAHAISTIKWERYWSKFNLKGLFTPT